VKRLFSIAVVGVAKQKVNSMPQQKEKYVSVDQLAQALRISERAVQRLTIYEECREDLAAISVFRMPVLVYRASPEESLPKL